MRDDNLENQDIDTEYYDDEYEVENTGVGKRLVGVIISLILLALLVGGGILLYNRQLEPVNPSSTQSQYINIPEGSSIKEVSEILKDNDLIRNSLVFTSYAGRHAFGGAEIQAATYELSQNMSVAQIFSKLVNGESYVGQLTTITFQEGLNLNEMAQLVQDSGLCTIEEFKAEAADINKYKEKYSILDSIPEDEIPLRTLEGYLYPDTYAIVGTGTEGAQNLIDNMLTRLEELYTPELRQQTEEHGRTIDDCIILASIVELETKLPEDRPNAASVFYNRMANNMPLQSDITIDYIYGTKTPVLTTEQTQIQSPYNTYINLGLPLGPIDSPGIASIEAAVNPADTNYLYFVADMSTGKLYFNETLDEHNQDIDQHMDSSAIQ